MCQIPKQYETARRIALAAGDRPQADSAACSQKSECPMNSHLSLEIRFSQFSPPTPIKVTEIIIVLPVIQ